MIEESLKQLAYVPEVRRALAGISDELVIGGMGGSALAGDALAFLYPARPVSVHRGYGMPLEKSPAALHIAVSYSGNTEEAVSFANDALKEGVPLAVVASGGTLASFAEREGLPLALVPHGLPPRNAFMYMVRALLALIAAEGLLDELGAYAPQERELDAAAEQYAHFMLQSVPLFYSSERNACLARLAKLVMNEAARMPAFQNVFPELNHNEMQSFDTDMPEGLAHLFRFVIIRDEDDDPRIVRRMDAFTSLMEERGKMVEIAELPRTRTEALARWWLMMLGAGRMLAETRGIDPDTQPLVDAFKKLL